MYRSNKKYGIIKIPRLIEFQNYKLQVSDFNSYRFKFLTLINENQEIIEEYAHIEQRKWIKKSTNSIISTGKLINDINNNCNSVVYLDLYVDDMNPSSANTMNIKKIFTYELVKEEKSKRYSLTCLDDVKVFHTLNQLYELEYS